MILNNKKILIAGGTGLIGRFLIDNLIKQGCQDIRVVSLDSPMGINPSVECINLDLRDYESCKQAVKNRDIVFNLLANKGTPKIMREKPASIFVPYLQFNTNLMEAAVRDNVDWFLFTSTVGVYDPSTLMKEDDVWRTMPSKKDWFAGWAKRMGELQAEAYSIEMKKNNFSIVRPSSIFGPYDNFEKESALVIPALISRIFKDKENPLVIWGDGKATRDFLMADEVAKGMIFVVENEITSPINLGSGVGTSIDEVVRLIKEIAIEDYGYDFEYQYDNEFLNKGDDSRIFDISRIESYGFYPKLDLKANLKTTIDWFVNNKSFNENRFSFSHRAKI